MVIHLGIDIGLTGAICALGPDSLQLEDMPTTPKGDAIDAFALAQLIRRLVPATEACQAVIEDVRPRPMGNANAHGNSMHSQGSLMRSRGAVEATLQILRIPTIVVQPQTWKREFGLLRKPGLDGKREPVDKDAARLFAIGLWPHLGASGLHLKKHHNRADAALLARFGQIRHG